MMDMGMEFKEEGVQIVLVLVESRRGRQEVAPLT